MAKLTDHEKLQYQLLGRVYARRHLSCNTAQLARDFAVAGLASRTETQTALDRARFAGLIVDASKNSAYRWRLTPAGTARMTELGRRYWSEIGAAVHGAAK
jgi:hypothetical protein